VKRTRIWIAPSISRRERGQAVAEYAAMLAVLLVMLAMITRIGSQVNLMFSWIADFVH